MPFFDTTYPGKGGQPYMNEKEAELSYASTASGQYTDPDTGKVFNSERALKDYQWDRNHGLK